ncbi:cell division protein FtsL [Gammaproteobacteria bacterium]|nr:cell division protein FtsL [Gammaproteobacteria bacterium]
MNAAARLLNQGQLSRSWVVSLFWSKFNVALFIAVLLTLLSALSLVYVTNVSRTLNADYQNLIIEKSKLDLQWNQLLLEKSTALTNTKTEKIAEKDLSMIFPNIKSVIVVNE